jgi:hypothetical protein
MQGQNTNAALVLMALEFTNAYIASIDEIKEKRLITRLESVSIL